MGIESKYVIRWAIPGWVYLSAITIFFLNEEIPLIDIKNTQSFPLLSLTVLLASLGLPVGYIIHQFSLFFGFVIRTRWKRYFEEEIVLDEKIITLENGEKIRTRYRHLLSRVHELRALKYALLLSVLTVIIATFFSNVSNIQWAILITEIIICIIVHINQVYFQKNLKFFIDRAIDKR